jgi:hypothetical protein
VTKRPEPVVKLPQRITGELGGIGRALEDVLGKTVSFSNITLLREANGFTVTDAAGGAGTALTVTRSKCNFGDAGVDSVRVVVRGKNSGAGSVTVQVYDVTNSAVLCTTVVTGTTEQTATGLWTRLASGITIAGEPAVTGEDQEVEVRVVGNAADDPILYAVHLQLRTTQKRV